MTPKMTKKRLSLKKRGLATTIQSELEFSRTCSFREVFAHLRPPKIFFQKSGSVTFVPLWCTNFMQKIRKILRAVSEIFKDGRTNGRTNGLTDMGDYIGPLSGTPGVQN